MAKTINREASEAIKELGVEVESDLWWHHVYGQEKWNLIDKGKWLETRILRWHQTYIPAANLEETIQALPAIGEKLGWENYTWTSPWKEHPYSQRYITHEYHAHKLLDAFLEGGMQKVSEYVLAMIKEK